MIVHMSYTSFPKLRPAAPKQDASKSRIGSVALRTSQGRSEAPPYIISVNANRIYRGVVCHVVQVGNYPRSVEGKVCVAFSIFVGG